VGPAGCAGQLQQPAPRAVRTRLQHWAQCRRAGVPGCGRWRQGSGSTRSAELLELAGGGRAGRWRRQGCGVCVCVGGYMAATGCNRHALKGLLYVAGFNQYTLNFLNLLVDTNRIDAIDEICESFETSYCALTDTQVREHGCGCGKRGWCLSRVYICSTARGVDSDLRDSGCSVPLRGHE
jgi:hypothetical protein